MNNISVSPVSFTIGMACGSIVGAMFDFSLIRRNPKRYAVSVPSGVLVGMYGGGVLGLLTDTIINDYGVVGGILCGCIGGMCGAMASKQAP